MLTSSFQVCPDGANTQRTLQPDYNRGLEQNQIPPAATKTLKKKKKLSGLIFIEMSVDTPFRLWHQRVGCHIFCRWDWASARGLVANTIEECKHSEGRERPINACSLGLINYLKKETEVWGHQRNLIRTRFIAPSLHPQPLPAAHCCLIFCPCPLTDPRYLDLSQGSRLLYLQSSRMRSRYLWCFTFEREPVVSLKWWLSLTRDRVCNQQGDQR